MCGDLAHLKSQQISNIVFSAKRKSQNFWDRIGPVWQKSDRIWEISR